MAQVKSLVRRLVDAFRMVWPGRQETTGIRGRVPGRDTGRVWIADDFDEPLPP